MDQQTQQMKDIRAAIQILHEALSAQTRLYRGFCAAITSVLSIVYTMGTAPAPRADLIAAGMALAEAYTAMRALPQGDYSPLALSVCRDTDAAANAYLAAKEAVK